MTRRVAALDIGSNTVHLLVAEADGRGGLHEVGHDLSMPRLGKAVQATGRVGAEKLAEVVADVGRFAARARELGAETLLLGATEAMRRAADHDAALVAIGEAAGTPCVLISPDSEARLSFRGAVSGGDAVAPGLTLVTDIGGGSTECILGEGARIVALASLPIGSSVVSERWLAADPPSGAQRTAAAAGIREALEAAPDGRPVRGIAVGGTATNLPLVLDRAEGRGELGGDDLAHIRHRLAHSASAEIAAGHGIDRVRARVLAGGLEIVAAVCERYALRRIEISHRGLRQGMVLAFLANGAGWPQG